MLDSVAALFEMAEKTPPAIDYFYMSPHPQWVPSVALKKAHQNQKIFLAVVGVCNLSSKVLSSIRVKLPFAPFYEPAIQVFGPADSVCASYVSSCHQVEIQRLDPSEKVYVAIFLSSEESSLFTEPQVIVGDKLLSRGMRAVGYFKRFPKEVFLMGSLFAFAIAALAFAIHTVYQASSWNPKTKALKDATAYLYGSGCIFRVYEKGQVNDSLLARHKGGDPFLFQLNNIVTRKDIFDKAHVVICEEHH